MFEINFLPIKEVNYFSIESLLKKSQETNNFTNNGPLKFQLENILHSFLNLSDDKSVVCFNNGTSAIQAAMMLYESDNPNFKWALPSFNFPSALTSGRSNVHVLPVDPNTGLAKLSDNLKEFDGFIITNLFGAPANIKEWEEFCSKNNKILIFDNASSPLSIYNDKNICEYGDISIGSLHHTKTIGFGEGGFAVVPSDLYHNINNITNFGYNHLSNFKVYDKLSSNFKMPDTSAAFIIEHVEKFEFNKIKKIQDTLIKRISRISDVYILNYQDGVFYGNLPVVFPFDIGKDFFHSLGIEVNKYYFPVSNDNNAMQLYKRIINFPLHQDLNSKSIDTIINSIKKALDKYKAKSLNLIEGRFWDNWYSGEINDSRTITKDGGFDDYTEKYYKTVENGIHSMLPKRAFKTIVDIGSGAGHWIDFCNTNYKPSSITGIEISAKASSFLKNKYRESSEIKIINDSILNFKRYNSVDFVISIGTMFHIVNDFEWSQSIKNISRMLKVGGYFLASDVFGEAEESKHMKKAILFKKCRTLTTWKKECDAFGLELVSIYYHDPQPTFGPVNNLALFRRVR